MIVLAPRDYAQHNREWYGEFSQTSFPRLYQATGIANEPIAIRLAFSFDENDRVRARGNIHTKAKLRCIACSIEREVSFTVAIDVRLVQSEQEARELFDDFDTIVIQDDKITIQELVEDDVLMGIPTRVCEDPRVCAHRPIEAVSNPLVTHRPFAANAQLAKLSR